MSGQSKRDSIIEVLSNMFLGSVLAYFSNKWFLPWMGITDLASQALVITLYYNLVSFLRSYGLRRLFNYYQVSGFVQLYKKLKGKF